MNNNLPPLGKMAATFVISLALGFRAEQKEKPPRNHAIKSVRHF